MRFVAYWKLNLKITFHNQIFYLYLPTDRDYSIRNISGKRSVMLVL